MDHSRNDIAWVRVADLMHQWGEEAAEGEGNTGSGNSDELRKLLSGSRPTFIFGNATMIQNLTPTQNPIGLTISVGAEDDVIDAEARLLPQAAAKAC